MLDKDEVLKSLKENRGELRGFGVESIGLFGSFLSGDAGEDSDLDFLVSFEENTFDDYMGLKIFLEELFGRDVDLVIESDVREELEYVKEDAEYVATA
jgi:predicted nucleotidyltransferase